MYFTVPRKIRKLDPVGLAIGEELIKSQKRRREIIDDSFNRCALTYSVQMHIAAQSFMTDDSHIYYMYCERWRRKSCRYMYRTLILNVILYICNLLISALHFVTNTRLQFDLFVSSYMYI